MYRLASSWAAWTWSADRTELAGDRDRFVPPALDEGGAEFGLLALPGRGQTGFGPPTLVHCTLVLRALLPAVIDLPGIEQRHRLHRDGCPVSGSRGEGRCRCSSHTSGECCGAGALPCRCGHHFSPSDPGTNMRGGCRALAIATLPCPPAQGLQASRKNLKRPGGGPCYHERHVLDRPAPGPSTSPPRGGHSSLEVLHLLAHLLDQHLHLHRDRGDVGGGRLETRVLASRLSSCMRKSSRLPAAPALFRMRSTSSRWGGQGR